MSEKVVLALFGSFNPPTNGHLCAAEYAYDEMRDKGFDVLHVFMIPVHSGYGKNGLLPGEVRADMCEVLARKTNFLKVERVEVNKENYSTTVETLDYLKDKYNARPIIVCGYDLVESFEIPGNWDDADVRKIIQEYGICLLPRAGERKDPCELCPRIRGYENNIYYIQNNPLEMISSTLARKRIKDGHGVYAILDPGVVDIIRENGYYDYHEKQ